jgi:hypothetical protein
MGMGDGGRVSLIAAKYNMKINELYVHLSSRPPDFCRGRQSRTMLMKLNWTSLPPILPKEEKMMMDKVDSEMHCMNVK